MKVLFYIAELGFACAFFFFNESQSNLPETINSAAN